MRSSPDAKLIASYIQLDRQLKQPVYLQIAQQLINAISRGYILIGSKMPGTRLMSVLLGVHRKTVVAAYGELEAQAWLAIIPNKGAFVMSLPADIGSPQPAEPLQALVSYPAQSGFPFKQSNILDNPYESSSCLYIMNDGQPDMRLTQIDRLSHQYTASMKRKSTQRKMSMYNQEGSEYFKEQLSRYLNLSRGLHILPDNVMITRSTEMSLYILCRLLLEAGDLVLISALSLFTANMVFQKAGARIKTIPIDAQGIQVAYIRAHYKPGEIRMLYMMANHQYPTTVNLSAQRRVELLALAKEYGFVLVEDDYDYDFQYAGVRAMPLASVDTEGMVIYLGSFGKSLAPAFRTGFVVAPADIMVEMRKYLGIIDRQGDVVIEQALGEMIEDGEIERHLKKSLKVYQQRRDTFCSLLEAALGAHISFRVPTGGLALWILLPPQISLVQFARRCQEDDLFIPKTLLYQDRRQSAIRLGFGHLDSAVMPVVVAILKRNLLAMLTPVNAIPDVP